VEVSSNCKLRLSFFLIFSLLFYWLQPQIIPSYFAPSLTIVILHHLMSCQLSKDLKPFSEMSTGPIYRSICRIIAKLITFPTVVTGNKTDDLSTKAENVYLCRGIFNHLDREKVQNKYTTILLIYLRKTEGGPQKNEVVSIWAGLSSLRKWSCS
jgi:hypothetical protein